MGAIAMCATTPAFAGYGRIGAPVATRAGRRASTPISKTALLASAIKPNTTPEAEAALPPAASDHRERRSIALPVTDTVVARTRD